MSLKEKKDMDDDDRPVQKGSETLVETVRKGEQDQAGLP
jgi:hypothetical protein